MGTFFGSILFFCNFRRRWLFRTDFTTIVGLATVVDLVTIVDLATIVGLVTIVDLATIVGLVTIVDLAILIGLWWEAVCLDD